MSEITIEVPSRKVKAFLDGATQMRVPVKRLPHPFQDHIDSGFREWVDMGHGWWGTCTVAHGHAFAAVQYDFLGAGLTLKSPFGKPGDTVKGIGKVKRVWIEKVDEISTADCIAENIQPATPSLSEDPWEYYSDTFESPFIEYWDKEYSDPSLPLDQEDPMLYEMGPWVWCAEFERTEP